MTEDEWLECKNSTRMLEFLQGKASDRKLRLGGCACGRRVMPYEATEGITILLHNAERVADGDGDASEVVALLPPP